MGNRFSTNPNWFDTLNEALEAEGLVDLWPLGTNIGYGETVAVTAELSPGKGRYITVFRDKDGRYERPVHYARKLA